MRACVRACVRVCVSASVRLCCCQIEASNYLDTAYQWLGSIKNSNNMIARLKNINNMIARFENSNIMIAFPTSTTCQLSRLWQHCCIGVAKLPEMSSTSIINDVDGVLGYWVQLESYYMTCEQS